MAKILSTRPKTPVNQPMKPQGIGAPHAILKIYEVYPYIGVDHIYF